MEVNLCFHFFFVFSPPSTFLPLARSHNIMALSVSRTATLFRPTRRVRATNVKPVAALSAER